MAEEDLEYIEYVEEKDFFRISESNAAAGNGNPRIPMTPWVLIQFRTAAINAATMDAVNKAVGDTGDAEAINKYIKENLKDYDLASMSRWETVSLRMKSENWSPKESFNKEIDAGGTLAFDNYFEDVTLEDEGGLVKCSLKLYDKDFSSLESIVMRSIAAMKLGNTYHKNSIGEDDSYLLQFQNGGPESINFRIRFGYADPVTSKEFIIDDADGIIKDGNTSEKYASRCEYKGKDKTVIKSPWQYFQMMDCKFAIVDSGLNAQIEGISMGRNFIDKLKILRRFAKLRGTPENLLKQISRELFRASGGRIQVADDKEGDILYFDGTNADKDDDSALLTFIGAEAAKPIPDFKSEYGSTWSVLEEGETLESRYSDLGLGDDQLQIAKASNEDMYRIELLYGTSPVPQLDSYGKVIKDAPTKQEFMSVKSLLREFCNKVPPIYYVEEDKKINVIRDTGDIKKILMEGDDPVILNTEGLQSGVSRGVIKPIPYTFSTREIATSDGGRALRIKFFYKVPDFTAQPFIRKYNWRNNASNLISSFSISSSMDFAQMQQKIAITNNSDVKMITSPGSVGLDDNSTGAGVAISRAVNDEELPIQLITGSFDVSGDSDGAGGDIGKMSYASNMMSNMRKQQFTGSITIPGDPFYLFTDKLQPYQYGIWIEVRKDRNFKEGAGLNSAFEKSYMTGFYLISKITHNLGSGGFKTTLELMKWPTETIALKGNN